MSGISLVERARPIERFWARVDRTTGPAGCWTWTGPTTPKGYGQLWWRGRNEYAHRVAIALDRGSLPPSGTHTDHRCRNRSCVNPAHLEVVDPATNLARGRNARREQTHCQAGHRFDSLNTRYRLRNGRIQRECRRCHFLNQKRRRAIARLSLFDGCGPDGRAG